MNATELALAKQITETPGFVWQEGMLATEPEGSHALRMTSMDACDPHPHLIPDLADHATLGCLLLSLDQPGLSNNPDDTQWWAASYHSGCRLYPHEYGNTPGEAIARAWLRAHGQEPTP